MTTQPHPQVPPCEWFEITEVGLVFVAPSDRRVNIGKLIANRDGLAWRRLIAAVAEVECRKRAKLLEMYLVRELCPKASERGWEHERWMRISRYVSRWERRWLNIAGQWRAWGEKQP